MMVSWMIVVRLVTFSWYSFTVLIWRAGDSLSRRVRRAWLNLSKSRDQKLGAGLGSALATGRSITVMMGRWSACTGLRDGSVLHEIMRLKASWVIQASSGRVQLWAAVSYVGVPGGSIRSIS